WTGQRILDRREAKRAASTGAPLSPGPSQPTASFGMLAVIAMIGVCMHILMDLPTSYGVRPLSPFDWHWFSSDWMPIVGLYMLMARASGLFFGRGSEAARRRNAGIIFVLLAANYGVRGIAHHEALTVAPRLFGPLLPPPCEGPPPTRSPLDRWPRASSL